MGYVGGSLVSLFDGDAQEATRVAVAEMAHKAGDRMVDITIMNTPIDTGNLRTSWYQIPPHKTFFGPWEAWESGVATDVDYAPYVEYNTRPHIIEAKAGGVLRWIDPTTGKAVFARRVMHPGTKGQHMVAIAADLTEFEVDSGALFGSILHDWARAVEGGAD